MTSVEPALESSERRVFLNVPYDPRYGPLFTGMVAGLVGLGLIPHCGLESQSSGTERLRGILRLLSSCGASIHDLSRMDVSGALKVPRFNMPFELGMAYALQSKGEKKHRIYVFDEKRRRLGAALSDMAGFDPLIHRGTQGGILYALLDCFDPKPGLPDEEKLKDLIAHVSEGVRDLQKRRQARDPFRLSIFRQMVLMALSRAQECQILS